METKLSDRKDLSRSALIQKLKLLFDDVSDSRNPKKIGTPLGSSLMSGFAMFTLKMPSMLCLDEMRRVPGRGHNLKNLFGIEKIPSDTSMREILDDVNPDQLRGAFTAVFRALQRGKALEEYVFLDGKYLAAVDGTGYFSSDKVHCESFLEKHSKNGLTTYHHQMLSAVIVHPAQKVVIPLCPEAIIKQDGQTKNDCERNACGRMISWIRKEHDRLPLIIVEDGLASNAPHIRTLQQNKMSFILSAKPGDHKFLFEEFSLAGARLKRLEIRDEKDKKTSCVEYVNGLQLNESNPDVVINFIHLEEKTDSGKRLVFSWVTDLEITNENAFKLTQGGRARWKIENETFNTLKNQGYGFEHNYGHGDKNLSTVLAYLMMLAFLVDQAQLLTCKLTQTAVKQARRVSEFFRQIRGLFDNFRFENWTDIYSAIAYGYEGQIILRKPSANTS